MVLNYWSRSSWNRPCRPLRATGPWPPVRFRFRFKPEGTPPTATRRGWARCRPAALVAALGRS
eukprot:10324355-Heterocapsa_arctica.AAC.1